MNLTPYALFIQQALKYGFSLLGLPKTGQTTVYTAGDDGTYQKGYPKTEPRFTDNGDGTITDNATGLMWQKLENPTAYTFEEAIALAEGLDLGGHQDWRLPNVKELQSIVDYGQVSPAVHKTGGVPDFFKNAQSDSYWSSTTYADYSDFAWLVYFFNGLVGYDGKDVPYQVRCVR